MVGSVAREKRRLIVGSVFLSCGHARTASRIVCARDRLHVCCRSVSRREEEDGVGVDSCIVMKGGVGGGANLKGLLYFTA